MNEGVPHDDQAEQSPEPDETAAPAPRLWSHAVATLIAMRRDGDAARAPVKRFNPRPPGVILAGSATEAVFEFLKARPGVFFSRDQVIAGTARTDKAVDWALLFLRTQGRIVIHKAVPPANTRYLRYAYPRDERGRNA